MTHTSGAVGNSPIIRVAGAPDDSGRDRFLESGQDGTVPVVGTGPTGIEALEPLVLATIDGQTAFLPRPTEAAFHSTVDALEDGSLPETDGPVVDHKPATDRLPIPEDGPLSVGKRRVLGSCGWIDPIAPADIEMVSGERDAGVAADFGIRARGRGDAVADDPVTTAWNRARKAEGDPVVVINANESDDRPAADRTLLGGAPLAVLDGAVAVAKFVGAEDLILYLNEGDLALQSHARKAIEAASEALSISPEIVVGPDEYHAGAPTAALEAMEGADRIEPRLQPPPPSEYGLYGRPTVIHTPRTVAQVRYALANPDGFDTDADDPGTRLVTVAGDVNARATVELPTDRNLGTVRSAVELDGEFKMACVGGPLGGLTRDLSVTSAAPSLRAGSLGTDGVVELMTGDRCPVAVAGNRVKFAAETNSGRCVPGREGTVQLTELLRDVYDGSFETGKIQELGRVMERSANCQIGQHAPRPVLTAIDSFGSEFRAHAEGNCPSDTCTGSP